MIEKYAKLHRDFHSICILEFYGKANVAIYVGKHVILFCKKTSIRPGRLYKESGLFHEVSMSKSIVESPLSMHSVNTCVGILSYSFMICSSAQNTIVG